MWEINKFFGNIYKKFQIHQMFLEIYFPFEIIVHQPNINVYSIEKEDIYDTIRQMVYKFNWK